MLVAWPQHSKSTLRCTHDSEVHDELWTEATKGLQDPTPGTVWAWAGPRNSNSKELPGAGEGTGDARRADAYLLFETDSSTHNSDEGRIDAPMFDISTDDS